MKKGFVALISVVIVGAIILSIAVFMIYINLNSSQGGLIIKKSDQARMLAQTCSEYALQKINDENDFDGANNFLLLEGNCSYSVISGSGENRTINSWGQVENIIRKEKIIIDQINPEINIVSWQEVADF
ncbi:MAG TPA: hypothetical protein PK142_00240 [bacterium]|nr:hypothetical protein [bacterium]